MWFVPLLLLPFLIPLPFSYMRHGNSTCRCNERSLPSPLLIAYTSWSECDPLIAQTVQHGANVIIWFSLTFSSANNSASITGALPSPQCLTSTISSLRRSHPHVLHLISSGGWNAPWPNTSHSQEEYYNAFEHWSNILSDDPEWRGFDGIDWDPEGHDDPKEQLGRVSEDHLKLIGEMSMLFKKKGYIVSMAPAQSYLDVDERRFDLNLTHRPHWKTEFPYHGCNLYAYWLAFYGETMLDNGKKVATFDWVGVQMYEGWSRANYHLRELGEPVHTYVGDVVERMEKGWNVDFGKWGGVRHVRVERNRLVIGLANGWADPPGGKFLRLNTDELKGLWKVGEEGYAGIMFWCIKEEGRKVQGQEWYFARDMSEIMSSSHEECSPKRNAMRNVS